VEEIAADPTVLPTWTHIVAVLLGGVAFKYFDKWLTFKKESTDQELSESEKVINSLMKQIEILGERITTLEIERTSLHERELSMAKALSAAEMKAALLEEKVDFLQKNQERLIIVLDAYEKQYGKILY
jgi:chromosome segregation ATPase